MEVQKALGQLVEAIQRSDIYEEFKKQTELVNQTGDLRVKINEFRARTFELQNSEQTEDLLDRMEAHEREYEKFRENPLVEDYLSAELAFCRMIQEIEVCLAEAVDFE